MLKIGIYALSRVKVLSNNWKNAKMFFLNVKSCFTIILFFQTMKSPAIWY